MLPGESRLLSLKEIEGSQPARVSRAHRKDAESPSPLLIPTSVPFSGTSKGSEADQTEVAAVSDPPSPPPCGVSQSKGGSLSQKKVKEEML